VHDQIHLFGVETALVEPAQQPLRDR